ncbi:uncharacterized protein A4U43_UnF620 [Asparagus officinalis]|uniref:Uncharacterized protein n=1 Tax=Asparagus officinalis TaxID=4686 RepID=A0A1R3L7Q9_ASPOF|nr:uncharacterized protein A4U43_UnF620 [Asparagus officinalis]
MSQYITMLDYYSGGLPIASMRYACSESQLGLNLKPLRDPSVCNPSEVSYTLLPNMAYIEFILQKPTDDDAQQDIFNLTNVELGNMYELVVTTFAGLYRYRFKFVARKGALLSVGVEKITEAELQKAVEDASGLQRSYGMIVEDYTSYTDVETMPGHYVMYLELTVPNGEAGESLTLLDGGAKKVLERCCSEMEDGFNELYKNLRMNGKVGTLEIRVVRGGTFAELMDSAVSRGASIAQYKVPRCIRVPYMLDILNRRVVSSYFSLASPPQWEPYKSIC